MDPFPPAHDGPRFELQSVARCLDDLSPDEKVAPRPGGMARPLAWTAAAVVALIAFIAWLLLGPSIGH